MNARVNAPKTESIIGKVCHINVLIRVFVRVFDSVMLMCVCSYQKPPLCYYPAIPTHYLLNIKYQCYVEMDVVQRQGA